LVQGRDDLSSLRPTLLFVALCHDKPGHIDLRLSTRAAHLAFLEKYAAQVKLGGPFIEGDKPVGSMLILDCVDEATARALLEEDPYAQAGLFERVELKPWKRVVGAEL
jgi:hypothetical protein